MRLLILNVTHEVIELAVAHRKISITFLPEKRSVRWPLSLDPRRGRLFDFLQQLRLADRAGQPRGDVNMIGDAANAVGFALAIATYGREICVHSLANRRVQPGVTVLRAKDNMKDHWLRDWGIGGPYE